jgi:hypothetical protein
MENGICKQHSGLVQTIADVKEETNKQGLEINHIKNRPPVWCTVVIAVLTGLSSSLVTFAAIH